MGKGDTGSVIEAFKSDMSSISDSLGLTESATDRYARETGEEAEKALKRRLSANSQGSFADLDLLERGGARELNYSSQVSASGGVGRRRSRAVADGTGG